MASVTVTLEKPWRIGETDHTEVEIGEANAGHLIDAVLESERPLATPDGWQLTASQMLVGLHTLRRQIVRVGDYGGVVTMEMIRSLSPADLEELQNKADGLEKGAEATERRGRGPEIPEGGG